MLHSLGQALQQATSSGGPATSLDTIDKVVKIAAVILGGIWTWLNYVRGRTFKRRLEPKISGEISPGMTPDVCIVSGTVQVKNVGLSKVDIEKSGTAIIIDDMILGTSRKQIPFLKHVEIEGGVLDVFERHRWIEPGETIEEAFALALPVRNDRAAVLLQLRIVSRHRFFKNIEWNANSIAELSAPADKSPKYGKSVQEVAVVR